MGRIEFIIKFAFGCFVAWIFLFVLSIAMDIIGYCWKFMFACIGIYGIYLTVTGKYKDFAVKMENFYSSIGGNVKH